MLHKVLVSWKKSIYPVFFSNMRMREFEWQKTKQKNQPNKQTISTMSTKTRKKTFVMNNFSKD